MIIHQISVFLENRSGQLAEITDSLAKAGIDLKAVNVAELSDYGVVRLIVASPRQAIDILKEHGFVASLTEVVPVAVPDCVGGLNKVLGVMAKNQVDIEYMYSLLASRLENAYMIFSVKNPQELIHLLKESGFADVTLDEIGMMEEKSE